MAKAGPPSASGGSAGFGGKSKSKCPLCRVEFSPADVVGGAELEKAGGNEQEAEQHPQQQQRRRQEEAVSDGGAAKVPPPKVAALLQR